MARVAIIVGHGKNKGGGYDPGACANGYEEFKLAREIAKFAEQCLRETYGVNTELINYDGGLYLEDRIKRYKAKTSADAIFEIHLNSFGNNTAYGTEAWHFPGDALGQKCAASIVSELTAALGTTSRGAKAAHNQFGIVERTGPTAVLVETCFISNPSDVAKVSITTGQSIAGAAIAKGIAKAMGLAPASQPAPTPVPVPTPAPVTDYPAIIAAKDAQIAALQNKINVAIGALK